MSTKKLLTAMLLSLVALASCQLNSTSQSVSADFPCICGTPEGAINSCLHPLCFSGEGNDLNPDCACGTISIEE